jgi:hypothetical protein
VEPVPGIDLLSGDPVGLSWSEVSATEWRNAMLRGLYIVSDVRVGLDPDGELPNE